MRSPDVKSYSAPFQLGGIIDNGGVAEVVKSANPDFKEGDIIYTRVGTQQYSVLKKEELGQARKIHNPHNLPLSHFTGILGMSGLTA